MCMHVLGTRWVIAVSCSTCTVRLHTKMDFQALYEVRGCGSSVVESSTSLLRWKVEGGRWKMEDGKELYTC